MKTLIFTTLLLTSFLFSNDASDSAKTISFNRVNKISMTSQQIKTLSKERPRLYKALKFEGNFLVSSRGINLYSDGSIQLLFTGNIRSRKFDYNIQNFERIPAGEINGVLIFATCECDDGQDDCKFFDTDEGVECLSGEGRCNDCLPGWEAYGPGGSIIYMTPF